MPLPTLTWSMTTVTTIDTPGDPASIMAAVDATITKLSHWAVDTDPVSKSDQLDEKRLELKPVSGAAGVTEQRISIWAAHTGSDAQGASSAQMHNDSIGTRHKDSQIGDRRYRVWINYSKDAGGAFWIADGAGKQNYLNPWMNDSSAADNSHVRTQGANKASATGYHCITKNYTVNSGPTHIMAVESAESLALFFWRDGTNEYTGCIAGAIIETPAEGRCYGIAVSGSTDIHQQFHQSASRFTSSGSNDQSQPQVIVFDPYVSDRVIQLYRISVAAVAIPNQTTSTNIRVHFPIGLRTGQHADGGAEPADAYVGHYRQIRQGQDAANRTVVKQGGASGTVKSIYFSPSASSADALAFDQG